MSDDMRDLIDDYEQMRRECQEKFGVRLPKADTGKLDPVIIEYFFLRDVIRKSGDQFSESVAGMNRRIADVAAEWRKAEDAALDQARKTMDEEITRRSTEVRTVFVTAMRDALKQVKEPLLERLLEEDVKRRKSSAVSSLLLAAVALLLLSDTALRVLALAGWF